MFSPAFTGSGESDLVIERSADDTVVVAVAELFAEFGSLVDALTDAVFEMLAPPLPLTVATRVMVADEPTASDEKLTVRLLPVPPHTPPPVALQETYVRLEGRLSVTTTLCATPMPLLVTVSV